MIQQNPNIQTFKPRWPDLMSLPLDQVRLTYDWPSDTLFVDFYGEARPAASVPLDRGDRDYIFARVDPETDAVVMIGEIGGTDEQDHRCAEAAIRRFG